MSVNIKKGNALDVLNLTPLIDVVFLLLIFFIIGTRFAEEDRELDVLLPSASEAKPLTVATKEVFVNIDHNGRFYMSGKIIGIEEVEQALQQAAQDNPVNQSVVIRADKRVSLEPVVAVMNLCNKAGIVDYTLTTDGGP